VSRHALNPAVARDRRWVRWRGAVEIERSIVIRKPIAEVFGFVSEPANDVQWCPKLVSVEQVEGDGPGPGARYSVVHRPVPIRPARIMDYRCLAWEPPYRIEWREDDGTDVLRVVYALEETTAGVVFTQHDDAQLGAPRILFPFMRVGIGHDVARQLRRLKQMLES
jgi:uncharacterized protein YndB with AHSA1/START domain